jgi:hypothetical protein
MEMPAHQPLIIKCSCGGVVMGNFTLVATTQNGELLFAGPCTACEKVVIASTPLQKLLEDVRIIFQTTELTAEDSLYLQQMELAFRDDPEC